MNKYIVEIILKSSTTPFKKMHAELVSADDVSSAENYGWSRAKELGFDLDRVDVRVHEVQISSEVIEAFRCSSMAE